ncbi:CRISPR-associated protein [Halosquirtibacter laminarini]|uniref:CRISPR-associated protein n=1 Tax=Halosquirtibacter laminarini TaxID=3374600 RepID=A0AC61NMA2_9BACT|nr:CRISPR-associated protein [Prolixibacteraceae bacterium]
MFINLSNHPSVNWQKGQLDAAREYGEVKDLAFPAMDPSWGHQRVGALVEDYLQRVLLLLEEAEEKVVHIMGEMTFTYNMVKMLKSHGVKCLASTTQRVATEENGVKTTVFTFVIFREY